MDLFKIKNQLLQKAIFGNTICKNAMNNCNGYLNNDFNSIGRGFIEFCVAKEFNIHRLPGFEQYYIKDGITVRNLKEFSSLDEKDVLDACTEIKNLYEFTQSSISNTFKVNNGKIVLFRNLQNYEEEYIIPQLSDKDKTSIEIPVNIINSYSYSAKPFGYSSNLFLKREININSILMIDKFLAHPYNFCHSIQDDECEVWVIEDNMFGRINVVRDSIFVRPNYQIDYRKNLQNSSKIFEENSLLYNKPDYVPLPCEYDKFTEWLINKNKRKIYNVYYKE